MKEHHEAPVRRETLSVTEAGAMLGVGRALAYRLARSGDLPTLRLGHRVVVPRRQLERLLDGRGE